MIIRKNVDEKKIMEIYLLYIINLIAIYYYSDKYLIKGINRNIWR